MNYLQAYRFLFTSPKWTTNLLVGCVALYFVPILGPMVFLGYNFEMIEIKHRNREKDTYPDFDTNRLLQYLIRGAWVFLVQFVVSLPVIVVIVVFYVVFFFLPLMNAILSAKPGGPPPQFPWQGLLIVLGVGLSLQALISFLIMPMSLRAGLSQDFKTAFSLQFVGEFLGKVWLEFILVQLFLLVTSPFVLLAGILLFCVGLYPAGALVEFARYNLSYQLYELYLERGGTPIPLKEEPLPHQRGFIDEEGGKRFYASGEEN